MDNYPAGVTTKDFDNPWAAVRDRIAEKAEVEYELVVRVNDEVVFQSTYSNIENLYEEGRKPEHAVEDWIDREVDYMIDRVEGYDEF
jgi:hypothetical protein